MQIKLLLLFISLSPFLLKASCPLGTLTSVDTQLLGSIPNVTAYSPLLNNFLFTASPNQGDNTITVCKVDPTTGTLMEIVESPIAAEGANPSGVAFSPVVGSQCFAAVTNNTSNTVSIFQVNPNTGNLTPVSGSPFATGSGPFSVAFSPIANGKVYLAVTNNTASTVSIFEINMVTGALTEVSGSPFAAGTSPYGIAFSPIVNNNIFLVAAINSGSGSGSGYSRYKLDLSTNSFSLLGTQTIPSDRPYSVAFSPILSNKLYLATGCNPQTLLNIWEMNTSTGALTFVAAFTGNVGFGIAYSPLVGGNLFIAGTAFTAATNANAIRIFRVDTSNGSASQISGSPFTPAGRGPSGIAFSPLLEGGLFVTPTNLITNNIEVYRVTTLIPTLTTPSQYTTSGNNVAIEGTISGGTAPYTITWQDSTQQVENTTSFSRTVSPTSSTTYYVATVVDTNSCSAGPSNSVTIGVRTAP
jgi:hypothetical protein